MFLEFFRSFFRKPVDIGSLLVYPEGKRIYREFHKLRREQIDNDALRVVYRLNRHGHRAYIVGGCLRDLLLGRKPKDFDVATSATPEETRRIFTNSRTIGRRFKIVHVLFRREKVIEVSTFRSLPRHRLWQGKTKSYLLHRDNRFGSPKEDAARRDFAINALYFDPRNESLIDYVGAFEDIQKRRIQAIGSPDISFQEDPVRMLRAAKFAALSDLQIAPQTSAAIRRYRNEIRKANASRLLDELIKIFRTGQTAQIFQAFHEVGLLKAMFPEAFAASRLSRTPFLESPIGKRLQRADLLLAERENLTVVLFIAFILVDVVQNIFSQEEMPNKLDYVRKNLFPICKRMMLPVQERERLIHIFLSQSRFLLDPRNKHSRPETFRKKIFFYEAFMLFKIHALVENDDSNIQKAMYWEIGPRMAPPERHRVITTFPEGLRRGYASNARRRGGHAREKEQASRRPRRKKSAASSKKKDISAKQTQKEKP